MTFFQKEMKKILLLYALLFMGMSEVEGRCCKQPTQGLPGIQGATGDQGDPGPQGATGPKATSTYIGLSFDGTFSVNPQEVVPFAVNAQQGNLSYDTGTGEIVLGDPGTYTISYGISGSPSNRQAAIRMDGGIVLSGSEIDTSAGILQCLSMTFEATAPMTRLAVINNQPNNSGQAISITASSVSSQAAYILIQRIY